MTPSNIASPEQIALVTWFFDRIFKGFLNVAYTGIDIVASWTLQDQILGAIVTIGLLYAAYRKMTGKRIFGK